MKLLFRRIREAIAAKDENRVGYLVLFFGMFSTIPQLFVWGLFFDYYGAKFAATVFFLWTILSTITTIILAWKPQSFRFISVFTLTLVIVNNGAVSLSLGGLRQCGGQFAWGFVAPMGALVVYGVRRAVPWLIGYMLMLVLLFVLPEVYTFPTRLPEDAQTLLVVLNAFVVSIIIFQGIGFLIVKKTHFMNLLQAEERKSEQLLLNILPREIAASLKQGHTATAQLHPEASILFLDLVGFTELATRQSAEETVGMLNAIYIAFDQLTEKHDLEKIKTIGDCYMVAAGVPRARTDHAAALVGLALELTTCLERIAGEKQLPLTCRVGVHSGPVTSGVIGLHKFAFDVWGDTVNFASRMESTGVPGRVQISHETHELVKGEFVCELRGMVEVKGRGTVPTWFVLRRKGN